jgi:quinol monooxygenase YgiN
MPGCISYVIARDPSDADAIWITEVWDSKESHAASLNISEVKATIQKAMPLIGGFDQRFETEPVSVA